MRRIAFVCGALFLGLAAHDRAHGSIIVNAVNGTQQVTQALSGFSTDGGDMAGMSVTAIFADNFSETLSWSAFSSSSGGVSGTDWSLGQSNTTFSFAWTLTNTRGALLTELRLDGGPGDTVFDRTLPSSGTSGSANGRDFSASNDLGLNIVATYSDIVALTGQNPVGDLYRRLSIQFGSGLGSRPFMFVADTDNLQFPNDLTPDPNTAVPEPSAIAIWSLVGLGAFLGIRRKRAAQA